MKKFLCVIVGILIVQNASAKIFIDNIHPFFGINGNINVPSYNMDLGEEAGIPFSTFSSEKTHGAFGWGIEAGARFFKKSSIYQPGIRMFYDNLYDSTEIKIAFYDGAIHGDATHKIYGAAFDNHVRIGHNRETNNVKVDDFLIIGAEFGGLSSTYTFDNVSGEAHENSRVYGATLGYLQEYKNGFGLFVTARYLLTTSEALEAVFSTKIGLRYTF